MPDACEELLIICVDRADGIIQVMQVTYIDLIGNYN